MSSIVVVGTQWGDEGKGKIVDYLAEQANLVARFQGGNNAGHTVICNGVTHKLHLLPSGILYPNCTCVIGNDVVVDPAVLLQEIHTMNERGVSTDGLRISTRAHVIMPYHRLLDQYEEEFKGDAKIGTTGRGIGPCYQDKVARCGIRFASLIDRDAFAAELRSALRLKNAIITKVFGHDPLDFDAIYDEYCGYADQLRKYVTDTCATVNQALERGDRILFEGAQAMMLDIDHGTYPYVTSSHPIAANACIGTGIGPHALTRIGGAVKANATRAGEAPSPTELSNATGDAIREAGHEYGTTTGRPRRCGWLDACILNYARRINGLDTMALTRLDILTGLPELKVCARYLLDGKPLDEYPASFKTLEAVTPDYVTLPGWTEDLSACKTYDELPANARRYVETVESLTGIPAGIVSVGPSREQTLVREPMFD